MAYITSNEYEKTIYSQENNHDLKLFFDDVELEDADLHCESLTIKSRITPDDSKKTFYLDNFVSKELTLVLHNVDLSKIKGKVNISIGTLVGDAYEYVPIGIFNIQDKPTTDGDKTTISLRDNSVLFDFNYNAKPLIDSNGGAATKIQILKDICSKVGVTCNIEDFIGSNDEVGIYDNTITARTYIAYLAEQAGAIATTNRDGELIFTYLNDDIVKEKFTTDAIININSTRKNVSMNIDGKCEQTGTPTLDNPIPNKTIKIIRNLVESSGSESTTNGLVVTKNPDGSTTIVGTATTGTAVNLAGGFKNFSLKAGTYITSIGEVQTPKGVYINYYYSKDSQLAQLTQITPATTSKTFTVSEDTTYQSFRMECWISSGVYINMTLKPMIEEGSIQHKYVPYGQNYILIENNQKNKLPNNIQSQTINGVTVDRNEDGSLTFNGTATAWTELNFMGSAFILKAGTYLLTTSETGTITGEGDGVYVALRDSDGKVIGKDLQFIKNVLKNSFTITEDKTVKVAKFSFSANTIFTDFTIYPLLELNSTTNQTEYESCKENSTLVPLGENELSSIGNIEDKLYIKNNHVYLEKRINKVIFNGNQNINYSRTLNDYFQVQISVNPAIKATSLIRSDSLPYVSGGVWNLESECIGNGGSNGTYIQINILSNRLEEASNSGFNSYASENPITAYYELATPQTIDLGEINLNLFEGINNIYLLSDATTDIEIEYYKKKQVHRIPLSIVEKYEKGDKYSISRVVYEDAIRKFENPTEDNSLNDTLYLNSANPYISNQKQIDSIFDLINGFKIDSFTTGKILGNPSIDAYDLIEIYDDYVEEETIIATTLANHTLIYNGVFTAEYKTVIGLEAKQENVSLIGETNFRKYAKTSIDNINNDIELIVGEQNEQKDQITQMIIDINSIQNLFQITGGINLIRNSVGFFGEDYWATDDTGVFSFGEDNSLFGKTTSSSKISIQNGTLTSSNNNITGITIDIIKSLNFKIRQDEDVTTTVTLYGLSESNPLYKKTFTGKYDWKEIYNEDECRFFADSPVLTLKITSVSTYDGTAEISDLMLNDGEAQSWQPASGEVWGTVIKMSQLGISCYSIEGGYVTMMTTQGFEVRELHGNTIGNVISRFTNLGMETIDITQSGKHIQKNLVHDMIESGGNEVYVEYIKE